VKTDTLFYQFFKDFPRFFFELIGKPDTNTNAYEFISPEIKQQAFRLDGLFATRPEFPQEPLYFVEVQFYKEDDFYERMFSQIFVYFRQYQPPNPDWYAIVIYDSRSSEFPAHPRYNELMERRVRRIFLNELGEAAEQSLGTGIVKLVVETPRKTGEAAKLLINKAREELAEPLSQKKVIELIQTIVLYKFPNLSRKEIEAMLELIDIKQTRVYQEAFEEGIERGQLQTKLQMVPLLRELGLNVEEIATRLQLDVQTVRTTLRQQP